MLAGNFWLCADFSPLKTEKYNRNYYCNEEPRGICIYLFILFFLANVAREPVCRIPSVTPVSEQSEKFTTSL